MRHPALGGVCGPGCVWPTGAGGRAPVSAPAATNAPAAAGEAPLICLVSSFGGKAYTFNVAYGVGEAAVVCV